MKTFSSKAARRKTVIGRDVNSKLGAPNSSAYDSAPSGHLTLSRSLPLCLGFCVPSCQLGRCFRSVAPKAGPCLDPRPRDFQVIGLGSSLDFTT